MSIKTSIEYYNQADNLHKQIDDTFNRVDTGKVSSVQIDTIVNKCLNDIDRLRSLLNKVNINDLENSYSPEVIENVKVNLDFFYEAADYIEKYMIGKKYRDSLLNGIENFIEDLNLLKSDYKKWANNEEELSKKFTEMLLHPNNIDKFINHIKRMSLGTMSLKEFKKIFETNKNKMIPIHKIHETYGFESFKIYKNIEEYNNNYET